MSSKKTGTSSRSKRSSKRKRASPSTTQSPESSNPSTSQKGEPTSSTPPVPSPENFTELTPVPYSSPQRGPDGRFLPGASGNPNGRPPSRKNQLTNLKQDLELAVRQNINPEQIAQIVHRMYELAIMGSVGAAKLLLDKTLSNARTEEDEHKGEGGVTIRIENMTLESIEDKNVIDVTPSKEESQ